MTTPHTPRPRSIEEQIGDSDMPPPCMPPKPWPAWWTPDSDMLATWVAYCHRKGYQVDEDGQPITTAS